MASSRIFVRNLPPNMKEEDFRIHFSKLAPITDAKFLPARRIGYVGFKTPEEAQHAVKYFNKSFIRMSRISAEIARSFNDEALSKRSMSKTTSLPKDGTNFGNIQNAETHNALKRKREDESIRESDPKLKEFLSVMGTSKNRTWQNEESNAYDYLLPNTHGDNGAKTLHTEETAHPRDEKMNATDLKKRSNSPAVEAPSNVDLEKADAHKEPWAFNPNFTDTDWLRSKTSRLFGLDDDEEDLERNPHLDANMHRPVAKDEAHQDPVPEQESAVVAETNPSGDEDQPRALSDADQIRDSGRLFLRNLPFNANVDEIRATFSPYGELEEVHMPVDTLAGRGKGIAYIQYKVYEKAVSAWENMDGKPYQGRLLHILPAKPKRGIQLDDFSISKLPLKQQMKIRQKMETSGSTFKWNPLYMNMDDIMSSISSRLGVEKSKLLDPTSSDAAVQQALTEAKIIQEAKEYFRVNGVDLESFKLGCARGAKVILVKNFPFGTAPEELRSLFTAFGPVNRFLFSPTGTLALVEFEHEQNGRAAFDGLKYRRMKDSVLFLELAPRNVFKATKKSTDLAPIAAKPSLADLVDEQTSADAVDTTTLYVRNLNFATTTGHFKELFSPLPGFRSARIKTKKDPKRPDELLSMGFGFVEFDTKDNAQRALTALNGRELDNKRLDIRLSQKILDAGEARRKEDKARALAAQRTKIVIKNLPFEATKKDVRAVFSAYGRLRSVRVPKKMNYNSYSSRGFAFAEFITASEAANAMEALRDTHFLGRKLALQFAAEDLVDPEEEIEKMQRKIESQVDKVALQKLVGSGRKKFIVSGNEQEEI